jgi:hypothetical protein
VAAAGVVVEAAVVEAAVVAVEVAVVVVVEEAVEGLEEEECVTSGEILDFVALGTTAGTIMLVVQLEEATEMPSRKPASSSNLVMIPVDSSSIYRLCLSRSLVWSFWRRQACGDDVGRNTSPMMSERDG